MSFCWLPLQLAKRDSLCYADSYLAILFWASLALNPRSLMALQQPDVTCDILTCPARCTLLQCPLGGLASSVLTRPPLPAVMPTVNVGSSGIVNNCYNVRFPNTKSRGKRCPFRFGVRSPFVVYRTVCGGLDPSPVIKQLNQARRTDYLVDTWTHQWIIGGRLLIWRKGFSWNGKWSVFVH